VNPSAAQDRPGLPASKQRRDCAAERIAAARGMGQARLGAGLERFADGVDRLSEDVERRTPVVVVVHEIFGLASWVRASRIKRGRRFHRHRAGSVREARRRSEHVRDARRLGAAKRIQVT
jgi:hypothetical protein